MSSLRALRDKIHEKVTQNRSSHNRALSENSQNLPSGHESEPAQIAAAAALNSSTSPNDHTSPDAREYLPRLDLTPLRFDDEASDWTQRHDDNLSLSVRQKPAARKAMRPTDGPTENEPPGSSVRLVNDPFSEDRDRAQPDTRLDEYVMSGANRDFPTVSRAGQGMSADAGKESPVSSISGSPVSRSFPHRPATDNASTPESQHSRHQRQTSIKKSSLDKPLPNPPTGRLYENARCGDHNLNKSGEQDGVANLLAGDGQRPIDLSRVADLTKTEETTSHRQWAPAVTQETVVHPTHEIRQEVLTREIHTHDVHHRILPVIDVDVLPARHFVPGPDGLVEVAESNLPGRVTQGLQGLIGTAINDHIPSDENPSGPRDFTARTFQEAEGDEKEFTTSQGFTKVERTWVHPPEIETGARATAQTAAFHLGAKNPDDHGLRGNRGDNE